MIYIRNTISKISFSYIMYISIILCRNYLQIVRSNYVYFGQINESVCLSVYSIRKHHNSDKPIDVRETAS